jgi:hypothetical protein
MHRSIVVRGPTVKDRFLVMDRHTSEAWWQYGAALESARGRRSTLKGKCLDTIRRLYCQLLVDSSTGES